MKTLDFNHVLAVSMLATCARCAATGATTTCVCNHALLLFYAAPFFLLAIPAANTSKNHSFRVTIYLIPFDILDLC